MSIINPVILASTKMTTDQLTDDELVALYMAITAGFDPTPVMGYEKAKSLFTKQDGTRVHPETLQALEVIVEERIR